MSLEAVFGFAMWLYLLWPFTMVKRYRQYWRWYGNRPDFHRDPDSHAIDPHNLYTNAWQLRWFPWLLRYLPQPGWGRTIYQINLPTGTSVPVYGYQEPTSDQVKQINQRVFVPLGIWLVTGLGLLSFHTVPEGRWVILVLSHYIAFFAIWVIYWKDTVLAMSSMLSRPHRYVITGIVRDLFPHPQCSPSNTSHVPLPPSSRIRRH
jgi:hypothetical protein